MKKDEKTQFIDALAEKLNSTNNFYLADISDLNVETTSRLRRICFKRNIQLKMVKNTLLKKAMEKSGKDFEPLFKLKNVTFFSLQKYDDLNQIENYPNVINFMDEVNNFSDTGAIIENLDLVITVDTSITHLAGGLNKKTWMLSRFDGCWRWLQGINYSKWYPSLTIFRQPKAFDWDTVIKEVKKELKKWK